MEVISKPELDKSLLRVPTHVKRVLRSGELGTYDVLELIGNTVNASADEVNRSTDWVETNGEILVENENERIANENERIAEEGSRVSAEAKRTDDFNTFMTESTAKVTEAEAKRTDDFNTFMTESTAKVTQMEANENARNLAETARVTAESERVGAENERKSAELVREELATHLPYVNEDGYVMEYDITTHQYKKTDKYLKGGIEYPELFVLTDMHLYISPNTSVTQFEVEDNGHLSLEREKVGISE